MKKLIFILLLVCVLSLFPSLSHALFIRGFTSLTGDVVGSVDHATCTSLGDTTDDGWGIVITSTGESYFYYFDQSATDATSSPDYIRCKTYTTSGVWILQTNIDFKVSPAGVINPTTDPHIGGYDDTWAENSWEFDDDESVDTTNAAKLDLKIKNTDGGTDTYQSWDGINEEITFTVPVSAPSIDAGLNMTSVTGNLNLAAGVYADHRRHHYRGAISLVGDAEIELQESPMIVTSEIARELFFSNLDGDGDDIIIDPNVNDIIVISGTGSCGAGATITCAPSETTWLIGRTSGTWFAMGTCACTIP